MVASGPAKNPPGSRTKSASKVKALPVQQKQKKEPINKSTSEPSNNTPTADSNREVSKPTNNNNIEYRTWRLFNVEVPLDQDPGKDDFNLHPGLIKQINRALHQNISTTYYYNNNNLITSISTSADPPAAFILQPMSSSTGYQELKIIRKSFDGRWKKKGQPQFVYTMDITANKYSALFKYLSIIPGKSEIIQESFHLPNDYNINNNQTATTIHNNHNHHPVSSTPDSDSPSSKKKIVIVGAGPAGLFAAYHLVTLGYQPLLLERGKAVEERGQSIGALFNRKILDPNSNLCYGEGGAGTWSDGKLTTRIGKNSDIVRRILEILVAFGAPARILQDGKPHLGTDRLVKILKNLRKFLTQEGKVEFRFDCQVDNILVDDKEDSSSSANSLQEDQKTVKKIRGVRLTNGEEISADYLLLSVGHSARKLYEKLDALQVKMICKPIAAGFRIEHPQSLINSIQFGQFGELCLQGKGPVPVADYRLTATVKLPSSSSPDDQSSMTDDEQPQQTRFCYSFCMCPGGQIVPTSVQEDELCVNGMSFSKRQSKFANSALVVNILPEDMQAFALADADPEVRDKAYSPLVGIYWQREMEKRAARLGGGQLKAPVQRATDFMLGRIGSQQEEGDSSSSGSLAQPIMSSYRMGITEARCDEIYPPFVTQAIRQALLDFDRSMKGFLCPDAILHGVETRTSAPVQILRDDQTCQSVSLAGLFPAGEGAGYAGGIVSAAVDGMRVAEAIARCHIADNHEEDGKRGGSKDLPRKQNNNDNNKKKLWFSHEVDDDGVDEGGEQKKDKMIKKRSFDKIESFY